MVVVTETERLVRVNRKMDGANYQAILDDLCWGLQNTYNGGEAG